METLALVALTIGLLAVIGAVVVAMREQGTAAAQPPASQPASASPPQEQASAAPAGPPATQAAPGHKRRRRRSRGAPTGPAATPPAPDHVMRVPADKQPPAMQGAPADKQPPAPLAMPGADALLTGLGRQVQLLSAELQKLRQQEEETERRLKLINGIANLLQDGEGSSLNGGTKASSSPDK